VEWHRATVLSGFGEAVIALIARGERVLPGSGVHREQSGDSPAFLLDKIMGKFSGRSEPSLAKAAGYSQSNFSSFVGAIREKAMAQGLPDEL